MLPVPLMNYRFCVFSLLLIFFAIPAKAQDVEMFKMSDLQKIMQSESDTTYVINFWATWCKPCVKEMPYFEKLSAETSGKKVKVVLVSLDFKKHIDTLLKPYLKKNQIQSRVVLLNEPDYNSWIDQVDPSWSGAIPATLFINGASKHRIFHEKEFIYEELYSIVNPLISE